jgi:hypothetical protein
MSVVSQHIVTSAADTPTAFGLGLLLSAATYQQGAAVELKVVITANHGGKFFFRVCPRSSNLDEACFGTNYLTR